MLLIILIFAGFKPMIVVAGMMLLMNLVRIVYHVIFNVKVNGNEESFKSFPLVAYLILLVMSGLKSMLIVLILNSVVNVLSQYLIQYRKMKQK